MSETQAPNYSLFESKDSRQAEWDPRHSYFTTRRRYHVLLFLSFVAAILVMIWVVQKPLTTSAPGDASQGDLASALIPILAAAIGINLFIEMGITYFEQNDRMLVAYLGRGLRWLHQAETEVQLARQWQARVYRHYSDEMQNIDWLTGEIGKAKDSQEIVGLVTARIKGTRDLLDLARDRLNNAEKLSDSLVDYSSYQRFKSSVANYFSILFGVLAATATSMQIFATMGVQLSNPRVDMFLTGLFIGGLVSPVHQVIANIWDILTKLVKK